MELKKLRHKFSVCKVEDYSMVDFNQEFCFTGRTEEENSLVCMTEHVPENATERDDGWRAFRIQGLQDYWHKTKSVFLQFQPIIQIIS